MHLNKVIPVLAFVAAAAGCSTKPTDMRSAGSPAVSRIFAKDLLLNSDGRRLVRLTRDSGLVASAAYAHVFIDKQHVAALDAGESIDFYLPPKKATFSVVFSGEKDRGHPLLLATPGSIASLDLDLTSNVQLDVRLGFNVATGPKIGYSARLQ